MQERIHERLSQVPEVQIRRSENLDSLVIRNGVLRINITLCPLYAQGDLEHSKLLNSPHAVSESRVATKWNAAVSLVKGVHETIKEKGNRAHVVFTFADQGVIIDNESLLPESEKLLVQHRMQYEAAAKKDFINSGVTWEFKSYSDLGVDFPKFVIPDNHSSPDRQRRDIMDSLFTDVSQRLTLSPKAIAQGAVPRFSQKVRPMITSMIRSFGLSITRLFILQYGIFDNVTSKQGDLNLYIERGDLLLNITSLFPHGNDPKRSRVDIKV